MMIVNEINVDVLISQISNAPCKSSCYNSYNRVSAMFECYNYLLSSNVYLEYTILRCAQYLFTPAFIGWQIVNLERIW